MCLTVRAGNDDCVAIGVLDPDLAVSRTVALAFRRVSVRCSHNWCVELSRASHDIIEVGYFSKPEQHAVANLDIRTHEETMVVFDVTVMELQDQRSIGEQSFVLRSSMIAT